MWGRTSSGRENGARFTAGHPYEVGGALGPVPGHSGGERCASPNPIPPQVGQSGKGVKWLGNWRRGVNPVSPPGMGLCQGLRTCSPVTGLYLGIPTVTVQHMLTHMSEVQ
jgi:hypothetical protein